MVGAKKPAGEDPSASKAGDSEVGTPAPAAGKGPRSTPDVARIRTAVAQVLWLACLVAATALAVAALCIAVDANQSNGLVTLVLDVARVVDLNVFTLDDGIMAFTGDNAETKNALINYGLGAAFYLVLGRVLERLVRP
ncbi:hypothetical protein RDV89_18870 [Nocardioides zeae]|uniref:Uncharacterized protein n=1 Tax=Nocardioides imazamoxiresistens TaxID=3231893 RepID=A0ABU3Q0W8_9ACTN|nr:hypothetical protein [Nocardioides zeae]MDT9595158.1 hypothetical protein [Nocardioides zeae]